MTEYGRGPLSRLGESSGSVWCRPSTADRNSGRQRKFKRPVVQPEISSEETPPPKRPSTEAQGVPVKRGPPEGSFAASSQVAANETRKQLRRRWQLLEAVFDDCCDVQSELSKTSTHVVTAASVKNVSEGMEGVQLEDV